ncbi:MAG: DUF58 domain-containing protein [Rubrivivax sp.]
MTPPAGATVPAASRSGRPRPAWRGPRTWLRDWWQSRLPLTDTWLLGQRNIYILPTPSGLAFAALVLVMLVASINYQLNLGYVLTFLLAGAALASMHMTHGMLRGLTLRPKPAPPVFAGAPAQVEVVLMNPGRARYAIVVRWADQPRDGRAGMAVDIAAQGQASATLGLVPPTRGWHGLPALIVETGFPFGLFRAWTLWRPAQRVLAWPRPEQPPPPLPAAQASAGEAPAAQRLPGGELEGVRPWRRGDTLRQVVWKKVAHSGELVSRETVAAGSRELWLDWQSAAGLDPERRLERLAAWVLAAERAGLDYGLRLPDGEAAPGQGDAHRRALLDRLALWGDGA